MPSRWESKWSNANKQLQNLIPTLTWQELEGEVMCSIPKQFSNIHLDECIFKGILLQNQIRWVPLVPPFLYHYKMGSYMSFAFPVLWLMLNLSVFCPLVLSSTFWVEICISWLDTNVHMFKKMNKTLRPTSVSFYTLFHTYILFIICFSIQSS